MRAFFGKVKSEWGRVSWIGKQKGARQVALVVGVSAALCVIITALDFWGQWLVNLLLGIHF